MLYDGEDALQVGTHSTLTGNLQDLQPFFTTPLAARGVHCNKGREVQVHRMVKNEKGRARRYFLSPVTCSPVHLSPCFPVKLVL